MYGAAPLSHLIFTAYYIPPTSLLSDFEVQYLYCHRLGIPLPRAGPNCHQPTALLQPAVPQLPAEEACETDPSETGTGDVVG